MVELNRKGVTIVLTTHYLEEAQELCDQIAIINRGQVVACEPTPTLLRRMDTRHVLVTPAEVYATEQHPVPQAVRISLGGAVESRDALRDGLSILTDLLSRKVDSSLLSM